MIWAAGPLTRATVGGGKAPLSRFANRRRRRERQENTEEDRDCKHGAGGILKER